MHPAAGGPPVVVERLLSLASQNEWEGSVITTSCFCEDDGEELAVDLNTRIRARILEADRPRWRGLSSEAEASIRAGVREADIVHLHTLWHPLNGIVRRACLNERRPYVLMPHGMLDPYSLTVKPIRKKLYLKAREGTNLRCAARLIFTSKLEEHLARGKLAWLGESDVISLGSDPPPDGREALSKAFLERYPQSAGRRRLLFLGRLHAKKGLEFLISALSRIIKIFGDAVLVVAGTGEASYFRSLQKTVSDQGLDGSVLFTGMLLGTQKWEALAAAELFLLPSHQENFALAAAEAMALGVPVIVSDRVNTWPDVETCGGGVVIKHSSLPTCLYNVIISRLADPEGSLEMGRRAQIFAKENYDWHKTAAATYALYERILEQF